MEPVSLGATMAAFSPPPSTNEAETGGAEAGAGSSSEISPPPTLEAAILSNDIRILTAFVGNPHLIEREGFTGLTRAANDGLYYSLKWCIEHGIGRSGVDKRERLQQNTALMLACMPGKAGTDQTQRLSCVKLLLFAGADPTLQNGKGNTPLHFAIKSKSEELIQFFCNLSPALLSYLFSIKNTVGLTPMDLAKELLKPPLNDAELKIQTLLAEKASSLPTPPVAVTRAALHDLIGNGMPPCVFGSSAPARPTIRLKKQAVGASPDVTAETVQCSMGEYLAAAARRGDVATLTRFVPYLTDVDSDGRNVFMSACVSRQLEVLQWLIENFTQKTSKPLIDALNQKDDYGCTPAHFAAAGGRLPTQGEATCMNLLIKAGGKALKIDEPDTAGFTPLHIASQNLYPDIVKALMDRGGCRTDRYVDGCNPLRLAEQACANLKTHTPEDAAAIIDQRFSDIREALLGTVETSSSRGRGAPEEKTPGERIARLLGHLTCLRSAEGIDPEMLKALQAELTRLERLMSS